MKIRLLGAELFRADLRTDGRTQADRQADRTKLRVAFCSFVNAPKSTQFLGTLITTLSSIKRNEISPSSLQEFCL